MAISIYFTESKDFKLIKSRILNIQDDYHVYVYADTANAKIPKDLIRELPVYGNNLFWVNTLGFDSSQLTNHIVLTVGRFLDSDEPIEFYIATKTQRYAKAVELLKSQGVLIDVISPGEDVETTKPRRRGRPRKGKTEEPTVEAPKKRGRPPKNKAAVEDKAPGKSKKEDKPKKAAKRGRPRKEVKIRKQRTEKVISIEEVNTKLAKYSSKDGNVEQIQKKLFGLGKVSRPKFDHKLIDMIKNDLGIGDGESASLLEKLKAIGMMDNTGKGGRLHYKD